MIKLICFDLDGCLASSRSLHYNSLNLALESVDPKYIISPSEHASTYDGLPTTKKLEMLTQRKGLPTSHHKTIWELKQKYTRDCIDREIIADNNKIRLLEYLKNENYKVAVCSNSIRSNIILILHNLGVLHYVDYIYSNEDVFTPKPRAEIYLRAMLDVSVDPSETLIIEDSHVGREAATRSGAHVFPVRDPSEVNLDRLVPHLTALNTGTIIKTPKWQGRKMNILIPAAGLGSRFQTAGYTFPKPLIEVEDGKPMLQMVVENLNIDAHYIFLVQKEHYEKYNLRQVLNLIAPNCDIIQVDGITEGAACTAFLAKELINNDNPLLIANSDQYVEWNSNEFMYAMEAPGIDAGILTFTSTHPKWSYAKVDDDGFVTEVAEKNPISNTATVGIYYWSSGKLFVQCAEQMIQKNIRTNNEFYIAPTFNEAVELGKKIRVFPCTQMIGTGTPEDLQIYLEYIREKRRT